MDKPVVDTSFGALFGRVSEDSNGKSYYSFQGIPYAKPPVGQLRFKAPQPALVWTGIRDAAKEASESYHRHLIYKSIVGSEDCLYLNVYTKNLHKESGELKPVMVWIHGGSFTAGSGNEEFYGPQYLMTKDIILITINYRLGLLGFLSLEDTSLGVPGNAGLKDQVMALKWVKDNVVHFGGDPNNVTLFGESAGAASVHLLMLSPMAKGLFHKAIAQSGTALNPWTIGRRCTEELSLNLNLDTTDEQSLLQHLMKAPVEDIFAAQEKLFDGFIVSNPRPHGPVIEKIHPNEPAFLAQNPLDIIISGNYNKVPLLIGFTNREGMLFDVMSNKNNPNVYKVNFETMVPYYLNYKRGSDDSLKLAQKIKNFYFGGEEASMETKENNYIMQTDIFFLRAVYSTAKNHAMTSSEPVYLYQFSVDASLNLYKTFGQITSPGACHADDLAYQFKVHIAPSVATDSVEERTIKRMTILWTNFAKYGNPNPVDKDELINVTWKPIIGDDMNYLDINEELKMCVNPEKERMKFWDDVFRTNPAISKL